MKTAYLVIFIVAGLISNVAADSGASGSSSQAERLTKLLDQRGLDAVAASDPDDPGRFVAALYYPGAQLLAVSAVYPAPAILQQRISNREYREAYIDLQTPATERGRFFVIDLGANGLRHSPEDDAPFDITYENGGNQVSFDGNWKGQKLSRADYDARYKADDERYTRVLAALEQELTRTGTSVP